MKNSAKITFWLNEAKRNVAKETPIYMRVRINTDHFTKSAGINIPKRDWDSKTMRIKGKSAISSAYNDHLEGIHIRLMQIITQLNITGEPYNVRTVKKVFEGGGGKKMTLMMVYDDHLKEMQKLLGKQYTNSTIIKYRNTKLRLSQFLRSKYKRKDINLYELNNPFMSNFDFFLRDRFDNSTTTVYKHYQRFTRVLNIAMQNGYLDRNPFQTYKIRMPKKEIVFLDPSELARIENCDFKIERLRIIRDLFVFCCYTGLGYKEVESISPKNLTIGMDGEKWLNVLRQKTQKHYQVPIFPKAFDIVERYRNHPKCVKKSRLLPVPSNVKYNAYLKEVADIAGIDKHLTTHIARKTFATTVMLMNGANIGVVSRLLGHSDVRITLEAYGTFQDQLMMSDVSMIRKKFVAKDDRFIIKELTNESAAHEIIKRFRNEEGLN